MYVCIPTPQFERTFCLTRSDYNSINNESFILLLKNSEFEILHPSAR